MKDRAGFSMALPQSDTVVDPERLIGEKAYDRASLRRWLEVSRIKPATSSSANRTVCIRSTPEPDIAAN
jgi:hypothetical protein